MIGDTQVKHNYTKVLNEITQLNYQRHYYRFSKFYFWNYRIKVTRKKLAKIKKIVNQLGALNIFDMWDEILDVVKGNLSS